MPLRVMLSSVQRSLDVKIVFACLSEDIDGEEPLGFGVATELFGEEGGVRDDLLLVRHLDTERMRNERREGGEAKGGESRRGGNGKSKEGRMAGVGDGRREKGKRRRGMIPGYHQQERRTWIEWRQ